MKLVVALAVPLLAGLVGSAFTAPKIGTWYAGLLKPTLAPPNWVFGRVWTALYLMMGVSFWLVLKSEGKNKAEKRKAVVAFSIQMALNALWSIAFFGEQSPLLGLVVIAALWVMIFICIFRFAHIARPAAWLLVPYILWVSYASYLNFQIWKLN